MGILQGPLPALNSQYALIARCQLFKINRIIGFIILAAVVYGMLQAYGVLPEGAPRLFPQRSGSPAA
jgi:hypothetical protein